MSIETEFNNKINENIKEKVNNIDKENVQKFFMEALLLEKKKRGQKNANCTDKYLAFIEKYYKE